MADILSTISLVAYVVAGICLVCAVFLWFNFKIPKIIGDLSGRTARKSIAKMRENNEKSGNKAFRPSNVNNDRGKITDSIPDTDSTDEDATAPLEEADTVETEVLNENKSSRDSLDKTDLLEQNATELLADDGRSEPAEQTTPIAKKKGGVKLTMLDDVIQTHTDEAIE